MVILIHNEYIMNKNNPQTRTPAIRGSTQYFRRERYAPSM